MVKRQVIYACYTDRNIYITLQLRMLLEVEDRKKETKEEVRETIGKKHITLHAPILYSPSL